MKTLIESWGGELAVRIPESVADHLGLVSGSDVELSIRGQELVIAPSGSWETRLEAMLDRIDPGTLHPEINFGGLVGGEGW